MAFRVLVAAAALAIAGPGAASPAVTGPAGHAARRPPATLQLPRGRAPLRRPGPLGLRRFEPPAAAPRPPPLLLSPPPPGTFLQRPRERFSPLLRDRPFDEPPSPGGFVLTVPVGPDADRPVPHPLQRYPDVAWALAACLAPPPGLAWSSATLRVSFKRDGSVFGLPRVPFTDAASADRKADLARSLLDGLKRCTPLPLSPSLGAAVAGEIFAIRFTHQDTR